MKTISKMLFAVILLIASTITINAQSNTTNADLSLKAQLMKMDGKLYIFITDEKDVPYSNKDITATAKIKDAEGKKQKASLKPFGETAFEFNKSVPDFKQIVATLHVKSTAQDLIITATFDGKGISENIYECPMHPSEMEKSPGKCAKCGMSLKAKKVTTYHPPVIIRKGS